MNEWYDDNAPYVDGVSSCMISKTELDECFENIDSIYISADAYDDISWGVESVATPSTHPQYFV